ncbi:sensor histidine kinase [Methylotenera sp.]|uniref:sensor histidine kinase n=1 Tax=Methylotenera sp. TaxID=2051956 RepID=UPI002487BCAE|nr:sensor histidine kinase [Methylotenera sp.]MDI1298326.1 sensor histidine kinase [Methylotenera sp.]
MLLLLLLDSSVLYHYANQLMQDSLDSELISTADDIYELLNTNSRNKITDLDESSKQELLKSPTDKTFYSVLDSSGKVLIGEPILKPLDAQPNFTSKTKPKFYYSELNQQKIRVVLVPAKFIIAGEELNLFIQVAETLNKRSQLRRKILAWILVPQIILIITASILLWIGIKKSLKPLLMIDNELAQRSAQDLKPILLNSVPLEVSKLVNSLNGLIDKLNQAIHSQNRFIADAAHQLRTPLAGIRAQIELSDKSQNLPEIKDRLNKVSLSTERLIHLVSQLLVLAKNQKEAAYIVNFEEIDLVSLVKNIILDFESHADNKYIELSYLGLNEKIMINGDTARLYDLIYNLIDNAIRYTSNEGKVIAGVTIEDGHTCLNVQDNGVGILESDHENVFKRFYRGNESLEFGTGLGLAIVKEIANLHDATIKIQSYSASEAISNNTPGTKITITFS